MVKLIITLNGRFLFVASEICHNHRRRANNYNNMTSCVRILFISLFIFQLSVDHDSTHAQLSRKPLWGFCARVRLARTYLPPVILEKSSASASFISSARTACQVLSNAKTKRGT